MNKNKISLPVFLVSLLATGVISIGGTYLLMEKRAEDSRNELQAVQELYDRITSEYLGKVDKKELVEGALEGMTKAVDDPYSAYLPETDLNEEFSGVFEGIGVSLQLKQHYPTVVQAPVQGSPAAKAGMKLDDIILAVDNASTENRSLEAITKEIRGKKGTSVELLIRRGDEEFQLNVKRDTIPIETIHEKLEDNTGLLKIVNFSETTPAEFQKDIKALRKQGAENFILDVRQNPGGLLEAAEKITSSFFADGETIIMFEDKNGQRYEEVAGDDLDRGFKVFEPTVVLVDHGSASAAEILAAALKAKGHPLIGETTYGKGTVQEFGTLGEEAHLKLTVMKWLDPEGNWLNGKGVQPTEIVERTAIANIPPISRAAAWKQGDSGSAVLTINEMLQALGYPAEGEVFTEQTSLAVAEIQKESQLEVSKKVDHETAAAIEDKLLKLIEENDPVYKKAAELLKNG